MTKIQSANLCARGADSISLRVGLSVVGLDTKATFLNAPLGDVHNRNKTHRASEEETADPQREAEAEDPRGEVETEDEEEMQTMPMDEMETQPMEGEPDLLLGVSELDDDDSVGMHTKKIEIMVEMIRTGDRSRLVLMQPPKILERLGLIERGEFWLVEKALYSLCESPRLWSDYRDDDEDHSHRSGRNNPEDLPDDP